MAYGYRLPANTTRDDATIGSLWRGYYHDSSLHGLPNIGKARGSCKTGFWIVLFLLMCGCMLLHLSQIFLSFISYNKHVTSEILQAYELPFPTVTFCNLNPIKRSQLHLAPELARHFGTTSDLRRRKRDASTVLKSNSQNVESTSDQSRSKQFKDDSSKFKSFLYNIPVINPSHDTEIEEKHIQNYLPFNKTEHLENNRNSARNKTDDPIGQKGTAKGGPLNSTEQDVKSSYGDRKMRVRRQGNGNGNGNAGGGGGGGSTYPSESTCPSSWPIYPLPDENGERVGYCYFWQTSHAPVLRADEVEACESDGAWHIILDEEAKLNWLVSQTSAFQDLITISGTPEPLYWLGLVGNVGQVLSWSSASGIYDEITWSNFASPFTATSYLFDVRGVYASVSDHLWILVNYHGNTEAYAMCQLKVLRDRETTVGDLLSTDELTTPAQNTMLDESTLEETTSQQTTVEHTTLEQTTTLDPTTLEQATTLEPTTLRQSPTLEPTTIAQTTTLGSTTPGQSTTLESTITGQTISLGLTTLRQTTTLRQSTPGQTTTFEPTTLRQITALESTTQEETTTVEQATQLQTSTVEIETETANQTTQDTTDIMNVITRNERAIDEDFLSSEIFLEHMSALSPELRQEMGYRNYEFILSCSFEGYTCDWENDFTLVNDPFFGNCYMFNSGWNKTKKVLVSRTTGQATALKVTLNIKQAEYVEQIGGASGGRVVIHPQNTMPHPIDFGFLAEPGKMTSFRVKKITIKRLPSPYGNCIDTTDKSRDMYSRLHPVVYSRTNCLKTCYQRHVMQDCGCGDPHLHMENNVQPCSILNRQQERCRLAKEQKFTNGELKCSEDCPNACKDEYFDSIYSIATWPSLNHFNDLSERYQDRFENLNESIIDNLLHIEVYYEDFNYEKIEEQPDYSPWQFASDIGGLISLWIGFSLVSAIEFLELGLDIIVLCLWRCLCKRQLTNPDAQKKLLAAGQASPAVDMATSQGVVRFDEQKESPPPPYERPQLEPEPLVQIKQTRLAALNSRMGRHQQKRPAGHMKARAARQHFARTTQFSTSHM